MERRVSKKIKLGNTYIGGDSDILVQSMLNIPASDIEGSVSQAKELAAAASRVLGVPLVSLLSRRRHGKAQKLLSAKERRANMKNRFYIGQEITEQEKFRRLLLVDDVCTTGATVKACADILRGSVAKSVTAMCLARTELSK